MVKDISVNGAILKVHQLLREKECPTIVFLHDSLGSIELWREFPKKLGEMTGCNVLVYDRQGYGKSSPFTTTRRGNDYLEREADVLMEVLNTCQLNEAILFGHSDGGSIALIAAAKYSDRVIGVVTEGAHIFVEDITLNGIQKAVKMYETTNLKERLQKYHGDKTDALFSAWTETWLSDEYRQWNIEEFLPRITCPVLVIQGEKDEYGSEAQVDGIVNKVLGQTAKLILPTIGHTPHKEASDIVLEQSSAFMEQFMNKEE